MKSLAVSENLSFPTLRLFTLCTTSKFNLNELEKVRSRIKNEISLNSSTKQSYGYSLGETVMSCKYNDIENCGQDFTWYYSFDYGNCFTFNSGFNSTLIKRVSMPGGLEYGLQLEIYSGNQRNNPYSLDSYGSIVFIHNQTNKPDTSNAENGIILKPGTQTNIKITKRFQSNCK